MKEKEEYEKQLEFFQEYDGKRTIKKLPDRRIPKG